MTKPKLRAVAADEKAPSAPPEKLEEAIDGDRRSFLAGTRLQIARTIDNGAPVHTLARLIAELDRIDIEIRRLDAAAEEADDDDDAISAEDEAFDASAI